MEYRHEIINFGQGIPIRCFIHRLGHSARHLHRSLELLFVMSGTVLVYVEGEPYVLEEGDVILINSNAPHELTANDAILTAVQIKLSLFEDKELHSKDLYFDCNSKTDPGNPGIQRLKCVMAQFVKTYAALGEGRNYRAYALCYFLVSELINYFLVDRNTERAAQSDYQYERIARIVEYINEHYAEELSLQRIAEREYLSTPYLSKFFQRMMGVGFTEYLSRLRLNHAVEELMSTDHTIENIAEHNGFPNTQAFVKRFREKYDLPPSQWRRQYPGKTIYESVGQFNDYTILDTHEYLSYFAKYLDADERVLPAMAEPELPDIVTSLELRVDGKGTRLRNTWRTITSVGSAKELLQGDVQNMLREFQRCMGFQYIKFHGILSDDMHVVSRDRAGQLQYSFVYVDSMLDFVLSVGLKPLIQLSFMPAELAINPNNRIFDSTMINSPPVSNHAWCDLVHQFLLHLLERYGERETESWLYTIWNEPDTPPNMFGFPNAEEFYQFYFETWKTIRQVDPRYRIGSPSIYFDPIEKGRWMNDFSRWCQQKGCLPDFVLFHYYGTSVTTEEVLAAHDIPMGKIQLTDDENMLSKCITALQGFIDEIYPPNTAIYLTEWNFSPSHRELLGDTCFRSCYLIKNILENYDRLEGIGYWLLTDLFEEHQVPEKMFHGGLGLYTHNGIPKAAWYAYWLLRKLGEERIDSGEGYFLTRHGETYQLMFYHYRHFSELYAANEIFDMTDTDRYTPFGERQKRNFTVLLEGMIDGTWKVCEYTLNRQHGSAFDKWVEMGAQPIKNAEEVEILKGLSMPMMSKYVLQAKEGCLRINAVLEPLEVKLILLNR